MIMSLFQILIFPGFLFLIFFGLFAEFYDRKLYARFQRRIGPPWYQPAADLIKLIAKEEIIPEEADPVVFKLVPIFAVTAVVTAFLYIPLWKLEALFSFNGDIIVVLYFLTIPTLTNFLGGWYSSSIYSRIGAVRALTQFFAYEVPLFIGVLAPALLADTWSLSEMTVFYSRHPLYWLFNLPGFAICLIALLGKLQKGPFDIPEAETEIVAGTFTEYSGRLFGFIKLAVDMEMVVGVSLLAAVFMPLGLKLPFIIGFVLFLVKIFFIISLLTLLRTILARFRIDQMINFCWKFIAPLSFAQLLLSLLLKGILT